MMVYEKKKTTALLDRIRSRMCRIKNCSLFVSDVLVMRGLKEIFFPFSPKCI